MSRKKPILIRRGGLSGDYFAITRYVEKAAPGGGTYVYVSGENGKQDVTADIEAIVAERCAPLVECLERMAEIDVSDSNLEEIAFAARAALRAHREGA